MKKLVIKMIADPIKRFTINHGCFYCISYVNKISIMSMVDYKLKSEFYFTFLE